METHGQVRSEVERDIVELHEKLPVKVTPKNYEDTIGCLRQLNVTEKQLEMRW